jgi:hypothetical protein
MTCREGSAVADGSMKVSTFPFLWVIHQSRLLMKGTGGSPWSDTEPSGRQTLSEQWQKKSQHPQRGNGRYYIADHIAVTKSSWTEVSVSRKLFTIKELICRSQWPRGLRRSSAAACILRLLVRISPGAWMFVYYECCEVSGRGLCDELIARPEESYRLWCVVVCDLETPWLRPWPTGGFCAPPPKLILRCTRFLSFVHTSSKRVSVKTPALFSREACTSALKCVTANFYNFLGRKLLYTMHC